MRRDETTVSSHTREAILKLDRTVEDEREHTLWHSHRDTPTRDTRLLLRGSGARLYDARLYDAAGGVQENAGAQSIRKWLRMRYAMYVMCMPRPPYCQSSARSTRCILPSAGETPLHSSVSAERTEKPSVTSMQSLYPEYHCSSSCDLTCRGST